MNKIFELFQLISEYVDSDDFQLELKFTSASGSGCFQLHPVMETVIYPSWVRKQYNQAAWRTPEEGVLALQEILSKCRMANKVLVPEAIDIILLALDSRDGTKLSRVQDAYSVLKKFKIELEQELRQLQYLENTPHLIEQLPPGATGL